MFLILSFLVMSCYFVSSEIDVYLNTVYHTVDDDFLSVTIDSGDIGRNWSGITFTATKIINMAEAFQPATLRVGGTSGDKVIYDPNNSTKKEGMIMMSTQQWDAVNVFVQKVGWKFIFGLNQLLFDDNKVWDSSNAEKIIDYTIKKGYSVAWELGNEPDHYTGDNLLSAQQILNNFQKLRTLLKDRNYPLNFIAGPDVASPKTRNLFNDFLVGAVKDSSIINAATWHNYYEDSKTIQVHDFYDVQRLDRLYDVLDNVESIIKNTSYTGNVWLGETSSSFGGGRALYSECFVSGFMWLDKLGITAYSQNKVFRQDFVGGHYALLNKNQDPLPDYWLSLLYKRLVGRQVLQVKGALGKGRSVRIYAHCAKPINYPKGSIVWLALNTHNQSETVTIGNSELVASPRDLYWLTPSPSYNITSQEVLLNGVKLALTNDQSIPQLLPHRQASGNQLQLQPLSFGFVVFTNVKDTVCDKGY